MRGEAGRKGALGGAAGFLHILTVIPATKVDRTKTTDQSNNNTNGANDGQNSGVISCGTGIPNTRADTPDQGASEREEAEKKAHANPSRITQQRRVRRAQGNWVVALDLAVVQFLRIAWVGLRSEVRYLFIGTHGVPKPFFFITSDNSSLDLLPAKVVPNRVCTSKIAARNTLRRHF